jgi:flavin-dependent dehydrogenase
MREPDCRKMGKMYDVVIVGGGVSGLTCATFLADAGLDVRVLEATPSIGGFTKENLQGFLGFEISRTPFEIPRDKPSRKAVLWSPDRRRVEVEFDRPLCYLVKRGPTDSFDLYLLKKARKMGAEILTGSRVVQTKWVDDRLEQVTDSNGQDYRASYFIAADGVTSSMRRLAGVGILKPKGIAFGMKMRNVKIEPLEMHGILDLDLAPHGYCYMIGYPDGNHASVVLSARVRYMKKGLREYFKLLIKSIPRMFECAEEEHEFSRGVTCNDGHDMLRKSNLLFVGEAGGFQDPILGFGMSPSIRSSRTAADAIIHSTKERQMSVLSQYERTARSDILKESIRWKWNFRKLIMEHMNNKDLKAIIESIDANKPLIRKIARTGDLKALARLVPHALSERPRLIRFLLYSPYLWLPFQL